MRFLMLGWSVGLKKRTPPPQKKKKNHKKSRNRRPWYPRTTLKTNIHIFRLTKYTIYCKKFSCFCFCFSLCCYYKYSFFRLQQFFQVKNGLTTSFFFNAKKLGRSDDGKRRKKRGWPHWQIISWQKLIDELRIKRLPNLFRVCSSNHKRRSILSEC